MNPQIFGFRDCQATRKAQRFFAERRIPVHFVDLDERPAARGELRRFAERFGPAALIDRESARFKALGLRVAGDSPQRLLDRALSELYASGKMAEFFATAFPGATPGAALEALFLLAPELP